LNLAKFIRAFDANCVSSIVLVDIRGMNSMFSWSSKNEIHVRILHDEEMLFYFDLVDIDGYIMAYIDGVR